MVAWKVIKIIEGLLDQGEREAVLGDILERGVDLRGLFDLVGLAALRQLKAWKSWRTWLLALSVGVSVFAVTRGTQVIADTASYYPWPDLSDSRRIYFLFLILGRTVAIIGLAWATGFTISSLARNRAMSILIPLTCIIIWQPINLTSLALLVIVPGILGVGRGWRGDPLTLKHVLVLAALCLPAFLSPNTTSWTALVYASIAFWPALYPLIGLLRSSSFMRQPRAS